MKKIAIATTTRADYGILRPLIMKMINDEYFNVQILVTGMHLSKKYGYTVDEIINDNIPVYKSIPILCDEKDDIYVEKTAANALIAFADYFNKEKPDLLIILGDRTEIMGICTAALFENIPIAHIHGGELTKGAIDDAVRHSVTKMSAIHFAASEIYRKRIIQMGEHPKMVFNVGALSTENILNQPLYMETEIKKELGIKNDRKYVVVTYHPVTKSNVKIEYQIEQFLKAVKNHSEYDYIFTKANADAGGNMINDAFEKASLECENIKMFSSLGMVRYLSAVKYSEFVLGNSSSGVIEAPVLGVPTINIGERQEGRIMAESVINCGYSENDINNAFKNAEILKVDCKPTYIFGDGNTSEKMVGILKNLFENNMIKCQKEFYEI